MTTLQNGDNSDSDVLFDAIVIGSGPGGSACAAELLGQGRRVCVIERGRQRPRSVWLESAPLGLADILVRFSGTRPVRTESDVCFEYGLDHCCFGGYRSIAVLGGGSAVNYGVCAMPNALDLQTAFAAPLRRSQTVEAFRRRVFEAASDVGWEGADPIPNVPSKTRSSAHHSTTATDKDDPRYTSAAEASTRRMLAATARALSALGDVERVRTLYQREKEAAADKDDDAAATGTATTGPEAPPARRQWQDMYRSLVGPFGDAVTLRTNTEVRTIARVASASTVGAPPLWEARDSAGNTVARGKTMFLAGGAIETPALVLRSARAGTMPSVHPLVGQFLQEHLTTSISIPTAVPPAPLRMERTAPIPFAGDNAVALRAVSEKQQHSHATSRHTESALRHHHGAAPEDPNAMSTSAALKASERSWEILQIPLCFAWSNWFRACDGSAGGATIVRKTCACGPGGLACCLLQPESVLLQTFVPTPADGAVRVNAEDEVVLRRPTRDEPSVSVLLRGRTPASANAAADKWSDEVVTVLRERVPSLSVDGATRYAPRTCWHYVGTMSRATDAFGRVLDARGSAIDGLFVADASLASLASLHNTQMLAAYAGFSVAHRAS